MYDLETIEQMHSDLLKEELEKRKTIKIKIMKEKVIKLFAVIKEKTIKLIVKMYGNQLFNVLMVLTGTIMGIARTGFVLLFLFLYIIGAIVNWNNTSKMYA